MRKGNPYVILLKDIENRDPVLASRFHIDIITVMRHSLMP